MVEDELKRQLEMKGTDWYEFHYEDDDQHGLREKLEKALPIGKKLFPEFFGVPNSIQFIKEK